MLLKQRNELTIRSTGEYSTPDEFRGVAETSVPSARRHRDSADERRHASTWRTALLLHLIPSGAAAESGEKSAELRRPLPLAEQPETPTANHA
jgi:hypothetical protein